MQEDSFCRDIFVVVVVVVGPPRSSPEVLLLFQNYLFTGELDDIDFDIPPSTRGEDTPKRDHK